MVSFDANLLGSNPSGVALPLPAGNLMGDPQLGAFQYNGGTTENFVPALTSPAIGAGDPSVLNTAGPGGQPLLVDQRGAPRSNNCSVDIGADQYTYTLNCSGALSLSYNSALVADLTYAVFNNGLDPSPPTTMTIPLPSGVLFEFLFSGPGVSETDPGSGNNGTVTVSLAAIAGGSNAFFTLGVDPASGSFAITATVEPPAGPVVPGEGSDTTASLSLLQLNAGMAAPPMVLYHFFDADPYATPANFTAVVQWADGSSNSSSDGTGAVSVVADPSGGFDVAGSHVYSAGGLRNATVTVQGPLTYAFEEGVGVTALSGVLYKFNAASTAEPADFNVSVSWGDGTSNTSSDGKGAVSVVADPNGGFDVMCNHTYAVSSSPYTGQLTITGVGSSSSTLVGDSFSNVLPPGVIALPSTGTLVNVSTLPIVCSPMPTPQAAQGVPIDDSAQLALAATAICNIASVSGNGTSPVVVTSAGNLPASLVSGASITISGVSGFTGTGNVNGAFTVTVTSATTFVLAGTATSCF